MPSPQNVLKLGQCCGLVEHYAINQGWFLIIVIGGIRVQDLFNQIAY